MCGFVGIIRKETSSLEMDHVFEDMFTAIQVRGTDGCGVYGIANKKRFIRRSITDTVTFLKQNRIKGIIGQATICIGHVRKATTGAVDISNCHPFQEGNITLAHNGVLTNHHRFSDKECDSHCAAVAIKEKGEDVIASLDGAYAFLWMDGKKFKMVRNSRRPLFITETRFGYVLSSEKKLTEWICDRNNVSIIKTEELPIREIWTWNGDGWDKKDLPAQSRGRSGSDGYWASWYGAGSYGAGFTGESTVGQRSAYFNSNRYLPGLGVEPAFDKKAHTYGDMVEFKTLRIDKDPGCLVGITDNGTIVKYFDKNPNVLNSFLKLPKAKGRLSAFVYNNKTNKMSYYVKELRTC